MLKNLYFSLHQELLVRYCSIKVIATLCCCFVFCDSTWMFKVNIFIPIKRTTESNNLSTYIMGIKIGNTVIKKKVRVFHSTSKLAHMDFTYKSSYINIKVRHDTFMDKLARQYIPCYIFGMNDNWKCIGPMLCDRWLVGTHH